MTRRIIALRVNGRERVLEVDAAEPLIETLRERCRLTGTHQGCDTAQCGACTVVVNGAPIKSCNRLSEQSDGCDVLTIEGLGGEGDQLHLIQQAFSRHHALQCGFCTPGFVMRTLAMVDEAVEPEPVAVRQALSGNLCRCTGYEGIVKAICDVLPDLRRARAADRKVDRVSSEQPGRGHPNPPCVVDANRTPDAPLSGPTHCRPGSIVSAIESLRADPEARPLAGGQSLLPSMRLGLAAPTHLIDLQDIDELRALRAGAEHLLIGAMVPHARVAADRGVIEGWPMLAALAGGIADQQVRSVGTLGGSLANNDPAACWPAGVLASGATVVTTSARIPADEFFKGIFATALAADELILGVEFPRPIASRYLKFEQPASRFALVGVAVVRFPGEVRVALTGLGAGVCRWPEAEARLAARFGRAALEGLSLDPACAYGDLHAPAEYRAHLAAVLLKRAVGELSPD